MEGREPARPRTKPFSAASSGDALSASAWAPYGHFYPWEPSWDQRGWDPLWSPLCRSETRPCSIGDGGTGGGVMGTCPLDLPLQTPPLAIRAQADRSSFLSEVRSVLHGFSVMIAVDRKRYFVQYSQYFVNLLFLCAAHHGINILQYIFIY